MATWGERIIEALTPQSVRDNIQRMVEEAASRAYEAGYYDGTGNDEPPSGSLASYGYKRVTTNTLRDFSKSTPDEILKVVWSLWQSSPIAKRVMTLKRDHIVGNGTAYESDNEDLQEILNDFSDLNELEQRQIDFCLQLFLLGEQIYPAFVRKADGRVELGYIDPGSIEEIVCHPDNAMERWMVICKAPVAGKKRAYRIVREDRDYVEDGEVVEATHDGMLVTFEQTKLQGWELELLKDKGIDDGYSGSVIFTAINAVSNQPRGYSDLVQVADWIDAAEDTLFALAEREQMADFFFIDLEIDGDENTVRDRVRYYTQNKPDRGGVYGHNLSEKITIQAPDLKQGGTINTFVALLTFIMGGLGYPVSWYGYGTDTNRSTLQEQATPSEKTLESDQNVFEKMMLFISRFVKDQAIIANQYTASDDDDIRFPLPAIRSEDIKGLVDAFAPLVTALNTAEDSQYVSQQTAARIAQNLLNEMGANIDPEQEAQLIEEDEAEREDERNQQLNNMLQQQAQQQQNGQQPPSVPNGQMAMMDNGNT